MTLHLDTMTAADLHSATVADIAEAVLARDPAAFRRSLSSVDLGSVRADLQAFASQFGWAPPAAIEEWLAVERALPTHDSSACWIAGDRSLSLDLPPPLPEEAERGELLAGYAESIFAGLVRLSEDAAGDRVLASLLSGAEAVPVYAGGHARGDLRDARSLKRFLIEVGLSENDPEPGESPGWVGTTGYLRLQRELALYDGSGGGPGSESAFLYERSRWTFRILLGEPSPRLADHLARAPMLADWDQERVAGFDGRLTRLNYWVVAHLLLGNVADAAEAARLASAARAEITRWLGALAARILSGDGTAVLGRIRAGDLASVRAGVRGAAPAALLRL